MEKLKATLSAAAVHVRTALTYVRTHKAQVTTVAAVVVGLLARFVPELPADDVLRALAALLSAV